MGRSQTSNNRSYIYNLVFVIKQGIKSICQFWDFLCNIKAHDLTQFHFLPIADLVPIHAQFFWVVSQTTSEKSEKWQNVGNNLGGGKIQIIELSIDPFFKMRP